MKKKMKLEPLEREQESQITKKGIVINLSFFPVQLSSPFNLPVSKVLNIFSLTTSYV